MDFDFSTNGRLTLTVSGRTRIAPSPVGMILKNGCLHLPVSSELSGDLLTLRYAEETVVLRVCFRANGSLRMEVAEISDSVDAFTFGPYSVPDGVACGEMVGAVWFDDGAAVCIQSLNPKTMGESELKPDSADGWLMPARTAAAMGSRGGQLCCTVENMARPKQIDRLGENGFENIIADPVEGPDASIAGGAVVLTYGDDADALLADISRMELEEGMPHPTIDGEWAKTSPKTKSIYFVISGDDTDAQIRMAARANVRYLYFHNPFASWGHYGIDRKQYPGGEAEFRQMIADNRAQGVNVGFHTLSNFIHTFDPYVSPVPHPDLLAYDRTTLTAGISAEDTELPIRDTMNYARYSKLRAVRIGDEIITYASFDPSDMTLHGCTRGAFGTTAIAYPAGTALSRLADHGYRTLFPNIRLQGELADRIGAVIRDNGIRRMSFDGVEGCWYTGRGEYAASEFVRRVYAISGNELLCDASRASHYRWHIHSYFNWGEPYYDAERLGGMYNYRAKNQEYFHRNLMPGMLGWYKITDSDGIYEATSDEMLEYMLARTVGYDAGLCFDISIPESDRTNHLLDIIRLWQEFRDSVDVPEALRAKMRQQHTWWHLERNGEAWRLCEMTMADIDLNYNDDSVTLESGTCGYAAENGGNPTLHNALIVYDRSTPEPDEPFITEPMNFRVRVGTVLDPGRLHDFAICEGWYNPAVLLDFKVEAKTGDYLAYRGGKTLYHYDVNYNLLEAVEGEGQEEIVSDGSGLHSVTLRYALTDEDERTLLTFRGIRTKKVYEL